MTTMSWSFIRTSTREAMFAGIQDAFDLIEKNEGDLSGASHDAGGSLTFHVTGAEPPAPDESDLASTWIDIRRKTRDSVLAGIREVLTELRSECPKAA